MTRFPRREGKKLIQKYSFNFCIGFNVVPRQGSQEGRGKNKFKNVV
jgi:hypothetical protein